MVNCMSPEKKILYLFSINFVLFVQIAVFKVTIPNNK